MVDLSGAFRFREPETFAQWYKLPAPDAELLAEGGLRLAGALREGIAQGADGGESRLLSDVGDSGAAAAYRGRMDRRGSAGSSATASRA